MDGDTFWQLANGIFPVPFCSIGNTHGTAHFRGIRPTETGFVCYRSATAAGWLPGYRLCDAGYLVVERNSIAPLAIATSGNLLQEYRTGLS